MSGDDGDEFVAGIHYSEAYSLASELAEARRFDMQTGRFRNHPAAGKPEAIRAEVLRRLGDSEEVREGIDDALAGRRPRW
jgi:hypothetical protein